MVGVAVQGKEIVIRAPYDESFLRRARGLGGRWDASNKVWRFDEDVLDGVRALLMDIYCLDPLAGPPELVNVKVRLRGEISGDVWRVCGREILARWSRDAAIAPGPDVAILEYGEAMRSGGSRRYPEIGRVEGMVVLVRNFPAAGVGRLAASKHVAELEEVPVYPGTVAEESQAARVARSCVQALCVWLPKVPQEERDELRLHLARLVVATGTAEERQELRAKLLEMLEGENGHAAAIPA
jgi:hypothetical protein